MISNGKSAIVTTKPLSRKLITSMKFVSILLCLFLLSVVQAADPMTADSKLQQQHGQQSEAKARLLRGSNIGDRSGARRSITHEQQQRHSSQLRAPTMEDRDLVGEEAHNPLLDRPILSTVVPKGKHSKTQPILDAEDDEGLQDGLDDEKAGSSSGNSIQRVVIICSNQWTDTEQSTALEKCSDALDAASRMNLVTPIHILHELSISNLHAFTVLIHLRDINKVASIHGLSIQDDPIRETLHLKDSLHVFTPEEHRRHLEEGTTLLGAEQVSLPEVWDQFSASGSGVTVCVVDTGLFHHDDLKQTFFTGSNNPQVVYPWDEDSRGHGTFVAGVMGANSDALKGVAPDANYHIVRIFNQRGKFFGSDLVAAAQLCRSEAMADIIHLSLGGTKYDIEEDAYFAQLKAEGVLVVAAAGNTGRERDGNVANYPANYASVISVGSVDFNGNLAEFSTRNNQVDVVAPGVGIISTIPQTSETDQTIQSGYAEWSGTSMSAPFVSGLFALLLSKAPYASRDFLVDAIRTTADRPDSETRDDSLGYGQINAMKAMEYVLDASCSNAGGQVARATAGKLEMEWHLVDQHNQFVVASHDDLTDLPSACLSQTRCYHLQLPEASASDANELRFTLDGQDIPNTIVQDSDGIILQIGFCPITCADLELVVRTDEYGSDTWYNLVEWNPRTDQPVGEPLFEVKGTLGNVIVEEEGACVEPMKCWRLEIVDTYGDGMLGRGRGIRIAYDSVLQYEGRNFGGGGTLFFGNGC